jgi:hypothetical protein
MEVLRETGRLIIGNQLITKRTHYLSIGIFNVPDERLAFDDDAIIQ